MNFVPDQSEAQEVPYFEDAIGSEGWEGHRTEKTIDRLKSEIGEVIGLLGGFVSFYKPGVFHIGDVDRPGLQVYYSLAGMPSRMDIAALPVRKAHNREKSLKMALYMFRAALKGAWFMQMLSPGLSVLIPFMIADRESGRTLSQTWTEVPQLSRLLPPPEANFDADAIDVEE
jgi:hypothetical protein